MYKTYALADSIAKFGGKLNVLMTDVSKSKISNFPENVVFFDLSDIDDEVGLKIIIKYKKNSDALRWSMKSILLKMLLTEYKQVIYVDNDIYFFSNFNFLFNDLKVSDVLLTPHHYPNNPLENQNWFEASFRRGLYNAGFLACNANAIEALDWWANCCLYRCEVNVFRGLFVDQKYLDILPLINENTKVLEHRGCNVAAWNSEENKLEKINNDIYINKEFLLVFYHFNELSIRQICLNQDHVMQDYFNLYFENLKKYKVKIEKKDLFKKRQIRERLEIFAWKVLHKTNIF